MLISHVQETKYNENLLDMVGFLILWVCFLFSILPVLLLVFVYNIVN